MAHRQSNRNVQLPLLPQALGSDPGTEGPGTRSILTPASGFARRYKFTLNPYSGCTFGCEYCYARFFAPSVDDQERWGQWVRSKTNAVELVRRARSARSPRRRLEPDDPIYMSTVTDPYQPLEAKVGLTRAILEELVEVQPRLTIQTRSPIVERDIDLLRQFHRVRVNFTITTDSEATRLRYEPHCPAIRVRLAAAEALVAANVPIGISVSPMLPLTDVEAFGRRLAQFDAAEYVTQYLKPSRGRFSAGSTVAALRKFGDDGWTLERYVAARVTLAGLLGDHRLLEGDEGYAPAS